MFAVVALATVIVLTLIAIFTGAAVGAFLFILAVVAVGSTAIASPPEPRQAISLGQRSCREILHAIGVSNNLGVRKDEQSDGRRLARRRNRAKRSFNARAGASYEATLRL